jgi:hypothetical protein
MRLLQITANLIYHIFLQLFTLRYENYLLRLCIFFVYKCDTINIILYIT